MDRRHELENLRRSMAMLSPGAQALSREEALTILEELADVQHHLDHLKGGLRRLIDETGG